MNDEMQLEEMDFYSTGTAYQPATARKRNLGGAILLAAIQDYRGKHADAHRDAKAFLYPRTPERQDHYDWVAGLTEGLDPAWLRNALDRFKPRWDKQRRRRMSWRSCSTQKLSLTRGKSDGNDVLEASRVGGSAVQQARTTGGPWQVETAAGL